MLYMRWVTVEGNSKVQHLQAAQDVVVTLQGFGECTIVPSVAQLFSVTQSKREA